MPRPNTIELIARGLWVERGHLLLCRNIKSGYRFLPGGHVEWGETAANALAREFQEEAGLRVRVGPLLLVAEHAFDRPNRPCHELLLMFHVEHPRPRTATGRTGRSAAGPTPALPTVQSQEPKIAFDWVPLTDLPRANLLPSTMAPIILDALRPHLSRRRTPTTDSASTTLRTLRPWPRALAQSSR
jgi:ADP-ribose pyrophosphatase YjhB (NUDIX family)